LELIHYIHLNPVRAGIVKTLEELARYPYAGPSFKVLFDFISEGVSLFAKSLPDSPNHQASKNP